MAGSHDIRYKKLFSNPILVKELLLSFVSEDFVRELDFSTLGRLDKSFITDDLKEKESDIIYRIDFKARPLYIYLLMEFQSTVDRFMALRILRYVTEFYEFLVRKQPETESQETARGVSHPPIQWGQPVDSSRQYQRSG